MYRIRLKPVSSQAGFTLVELVAVMVLMSILGAVAFARIGNLTSYEDRVFKDRLVSSLRLAQRNALSHDTVTINWQLERAAGNVWNYAILMAGTERHDEEQVVDIRVNYNVSLTGGNTLSGVLDAGETLQLRYDERGGLIWASDGTESGNTDSSLQLTAGTLGLCVSLTGYAYDGTCR